MKASRAAVRQAKTLEELSAQVADMQVQLDALPDALRAIVREEAAKSKLPKPVGDAPGKKMETQA